jgi:hypothetical protein
MMNGKMAKKIRREINTNIKYAKLTASGKKKMIQLLKKAVVNIQREC